MKLKLQNLIDYSLCPNLYAYYRDNPVKPSKTHFFEEERLTNDEQKIREVLLKILSLIKDEKDISQNALMKIWESIYFKDQTLISKSEKSRCAELFKSIAVLKEHLFSFKHEVFLLNYSYDFAISDSYILESCIEAIMVLPDKSLQLLIFSSDQSSLSSYKVMGALLAIYKSLIGGGSNQIISSVKILSFNESDLTISEKTLYPNEEYVKYARESLINIFNAINANILYPNQLGYKNCPLPKEKCCGKVSQ